MKDDWWGRFITYDGWNGDYIAWDETQANELGRFFLYDTAKEAILEYAKTLDKKENKMDFQVGDKVVCLLNGDGIINKILNNIKFPVCVSFNNGESERYTENGYMAYSFKNPCLFHEGTEINVKPAEPKRYPWVNIYLGEYGECLPGANKATKEIAIAGIDGSCGKYIDTIQLKPKGE